MDRVEEEKQRAEKKEDLQMRPSPKESVESSKDKRKIQFVFAIVHVESLCYSISFQFFFL